MFGICSFHDCMCYMIGVRPDRCTVVPVMNGHPRDQAKVSVHCRWPLIRGNLTPKAGTTVLDFERSSVDPHL